MKIEILSIVKKQHSDYDLLYQKLSKMSSRFVDIQIKTLFNKDIAKAQTLNSNKAKASYSRAFEPYIDKSYKIAMHPDGKIINSFEFSKLINDKMSINFFIGGAYGLEKGFLDKCDSVISLGRITMSHKIAQLVLLEQIYRAFSILSGHPYHK